MKTKMILCDLGRTLIQLDERNIARTLEETARQNHAHVDHWPAAAALHGFFYLPRGNDPSRHHELETGRYEFAQIRDDLEEAFGISLTVEDLMQVWCSIFNGEIDEVFTAMHRARSRGISVAFCSNTNEVHWQFLLEKYPRLREISDRAFLSFEMGYLKSEPEFFPKVVEQSGLEPGQMLFLDDLPENIESARACGIETILYDGKLQNHAAWSCDD